VVECRSLEFSMELVVGGYTSMKEVAARRGNDGWRQAFELDHMSLAGETAHT